MKKGNAKKLIRNLRKNDELFNSMLCPKCQEVVCDDDCININKRKNKK